MHFDDRLDTVLRLPDSGDAIARVQYLQLVDILGRIPGHASSTVLDQAFARLGALSARLPAIDRARLLRQQSQPIANSRLATQLAQAEPAVASAAITMTSLDTAEWLALIPTLPVRARGILRHRRDLPVEVIGLLERLGIHDRGLPPVAVQAEAATPAADGDDYLSDDVLELLDLADAPPPPTSISEWARVRAAREQASSASADAGGADAGIGAIVRRIEEFRRARETSHTAAHEPGGESPPLPFGDLAGAERAAERKALTIDFATDARGRVNLAEGAHASAVFGLDLGSAGDEAGCPALASAIGHHLPIDGARLLIAGAPAVSGEWRVDAVPRFDIESGRFTGYCGRLRRRAAPDAVDAASHSGEADRMREILHELRTPANAIQVAAEIIQQQLYGPAPHEYRALAASIASDCAHILAGFEELDRLVKLETAALSLEAGDCDLAQVLAQTVARLRSWTDPRRSGFAVDPATVPTHLPVRLDVTEAERLVWRLFAALAGATAPDEALPLTWSQDQDYVTVRVGLPAALAMREDGDLFGTPPGEPGQSLTAGMFGIGFTLRLATAEAAAAGGGLRRENNALQLWLPGLTLAKTRNSNPASSSH